MASYRFVTIWRLEAPIERVFTEIDDIEHWPAWWPSVRRVERLESGDADGIGSVFRTTFQGRLPYQLRFDLTTTSRVPPTSLVGTAMGELDGIGDWTLWQEGGWTHVRYVWAIRTTARWMNLLAPLPFIDDIFRLNHHAVMRDGLTGIRRRLGGVAGTYTRED
jgi:hypothetical protein